MGFFIFSICFEGACLSYLVKQESIVSFSFLQRFLPLDQNSIKFLIGNPGTILRSIVWNSAKGGFVLIVGSTCYTLAVPKLALHDTQALIDLHKSNNVELDFEKIQELQRQAINYYESNDIFKSLKFHTEVSSGNTASTTSAVVKAIFDKK